jgi:hypothetical protein
MLISKRSITAALVALFASSMCQKANAQLPWEYWQVPTDPVNCAEQKLEKRLLEGYLGGALSPIELAQLRSDLDWFKDRENVARLSEGLTCNETAKLLDRLELLRFNIESHMGDKKMLANITERVPK